nr:MAG TPA: Insecticidal delta-endotoxin CryIA(c) domain 5 [Caudoviricetes sp.]
MCFHMVLKPQTRYLVSGYPPHFSVVKSPVT